MKRLIIPLIAAGLLNGCTGARQPMTAEQQQAFLSDQSAQHTAELESVEAQAKAQGLSLEQLQDKERAEQEHKGFNAELERSQAKYYSEQRVRNYERLCEAAHPYMVSQCMINSGINQMVDSL